MTFIPFLVLIGALFLVVLYELFFAFLRISHFGGHDKQEWAVVYWILIVVVLFCCRVICMKPGDLAIWFPLFLVAFIHSVTDIDLYLFKRDPPPPSNPRSSSESRCDRLDKSHSDVSEETPEQNEDEEVE